MECRMREEILCRQARGHSSCAPEQVLSAQSTHDRLVGVKLRRCTLTARNPSSVTVSRREPWKLRLIASRNALRKIAVSVRVVKRTRLVVKRTRLPHRVTQHLVLSTDMTVMLVFTLTTRCGARVQKQMCRRLISPDMHVTDTRHASLSGPTT